MTHFKGALLEELRARQAVEPARVRTGFKWKIRAATMGVTATVAATAIAMTVSFSPATAAFVVKSNNDGTVTVTVNSLKDSAGLQRELLSAGVTAVAVYAPPGKQCKRPWFTPVKMSVGGLQMLQGARKVGNSWTFTVDKKKLHPGETLVITAEWAMVVPPYPQSSAPLMVEVSVATGPVQQCHLVDNPPYIPPTQFVPAVPYSK
jgi:hypothetical protein